MQHTITFADVHRVKRHAKKIKVDFPDLPHSKRLDKAAVEICGARNFHELNRWFERAINQHVDTPDEPNSVSHCRYCDFRFAADHKPDQKVHREFHEAYMEAEEKLAYRPGTHVERERMKKDGYHQMNHGEHEEDRVAGLLMVTQGWFDRSLSLAIEAGCWSKHPTFEVFVAMMVPHLETMNSVLAAIFAKRYGRVPDVIPSGQTNWSAN